MQKEQELKDSQIRKHYKEGDNVSLKQRSRLLSLLLLLS
jgi:hypothetical protein